MEALSYMERFERGLDLNCAKRDRIVRIQLRTARRIIVHNYSQDGRYWSLMLWLSEHAPRRFLSLVEAVSWLRKEVRRQKALKAESHWAFDGFRLSQARKRLIVARYFNRFSQAIFAREAA